MGKNKRKDGIKYELTSRIGLSIIAVMFLVMVVVIGIVYKMLTDANTNQLKLDSEAAALETENYFIPFERMVEQLAINNHVEEILTSTTKGNTFLQNEMYEEVLEELKAAQQLDSVNILATWIGDIDSNAVMMSDGYVSGSDFEITTRQWFECTKTGKITLTTPYEDISTGKMIISVAVPVYDSSKTIIGISGMDIAIDDISTVMSKYTIGKEGYAALIDKSGSFVYHPDSSYINVMIQDLDISQNIITTVEQQNTGSLKYTINGVLRYSYAAKVGETGFMVLSSIPLSQYYSSLVSAVGFVFFVFLAGLVFIVLSMAKTAEKIANPLVKLNENALRLAEGNFDVEIDAVSKDEVGELGRSIAKTVERLQEYINYIEEISEVLTKMANGKLTVELKYDYIGEFEKVKRALFHISDSMNEVMANISESASQVSVGSDDLAKSAQNMAESSQTQAAAVEELLAMAGTVAEQVKDNKNDSEKSAAYIREVADKMEMSKEQMAAMRQAMDNIKESSAKVVGVIKTIEDIAEQTNLLSLNASIEAARAGEAGRGFAVVAGEIGSLANESGNAVNTTRDLIGVSLAEIEKGNALAAEVVSSLDSVVEKVEIANKMIQNNAKTAEIQMHSVDQIRDGVNEMSHGIQDNSAMAEETSATSEELAAQAVNLNELIGRFELKK